MLRIPHSIHEALELSPKFVGVGMLGTGVFSLLLPEFFASLFGLRAHSANYGSGLVELRAYYGGAGMGTGLFLLTCRDPKQALLFLRSCMLPLALTRLVSLSRISSLIVRDPLQYAMHIFALLGVEIPLLLVSSLALTVASKLGIDEFSVDLVLSGKISALSRIVSWGMAAQALAFMIKPVETGIKFGLDGSRSAAAWVELQSMFGAQRLGFALYALTGGNEAFTRLFLACYFSFQALVRALAVSRQAAAKDNSNSGESGLQVQASTALVETILALVFLRGYGKAIKRV